MNIDKLQLTKLNFSELETLISWAKEEGWDPGLSDATLFWETDPNGFYGYFNNQELVAGGAIVSYNGEFGFMGLFIVHPKYRHLGIGRKLWHQRKNKLLSRINKDASIGLDGVVAMQDFYNKGGFDIAFRDERHEKLGAHFKVHTHVSKISELDTEDVIKYDTECFGFHRPQFLLPWLKQPYGFSFKYVESGLLKGYAVLRKTWKGYKICPLFADDQFIAEELYKACLNEVPNELVYIDIPMNNKLAVDLVFKYQTTYIFECARMYLNNMPSIPNQKIFGITTFELG